MSKVILYNMPLHELLQRGKKQGLWPIPEPLQKHTTEYILKAENERTGHAIKYIRAVYHAGRTLAPGDWPSLYSKTERVRADLTEVGKGRYKSRPNPVKRAAIERNAHNRQVTIRHNRANPIEEDSTDIRTNAKALQRVCEQYAPVLTNGRMRPKSKQTTMFSTGFAPPSRKDQTGLKLKGKSQKRFRKD